MPEPRILVADGEYIIAMEAARILGDLLPYPVTIVNPARGAGAIVWEGLALALIDTGFRLDADALALAAEARRRGVALAFTTASAGYLRGVPGFVDAPVLGKPFDPASFAAAIPPLLKPRGVAPTTG